MTISRPGSWRRLLRIAALCAAPLALSSCGSGAKLCAVHGQVFYEGRPACGAVVVYHPQDDPAAPATAATDDPRGPRVSMADMPMARVGPDGSFDLTTYSRGRGAPAGRYAVTVTWTAPTDGADDGGGPSYLPYRYGHPATSGLSAEVKDGDSQPVVFQLTR